MNADVAASYAHCRRVARHAASSFYLSFFLLPRPQRNAMCALYAFLRQTDDLVDNDRPLATRQAQLDAWRGELQSAFASTTTNQVLAALVDTAGRFAVPQQYLLAAIDGAQMDLSHNRYATFAELEGYCHRAASIVGLACIRIWGCRDPRADEPARKCGLAFQLTNILRDVAEDAARDRIYLPQAELAQFGCSDADILGGVRSQQLTSLIEFQTNRAAAIYEEAKQLGRYLPSPGRRAWRVMMVTYRAILDEVIRRRYDVLGPPIRFSRAQRVQLALRGLLARQLTPSEESARPTELAIAKGASRPGNS